MKYKIVIIDDDVFKTWDPYAADRINLNSNLNAVLL